MRKSSNQQTSLSKQRSNTPCGPFLFLPTTIWQSIRLSIKTPFLSLRMKMTTSPSASIEPDSRRLDQPRTWIVVVFNRAVKLGQGDYWQVQFKCHLLQPATDLPDLVNP
ncbi:MAG: hypothetical protein OSA05_10005 [Nitrospinaceae bacterium]|nr:hypothetical protein [Nitrospinaceae bacterium]